MIESEKNTNRLKQAVDITVLGLSVNFVLVVLKIIIGIIGNSSAVIADGIHSLSDSISDIFLIFGFRFVDRPPDKTHNYGHGKIETLLTAVVSIIIIISAFIILLGNSNLIFDHLSGEEILAKPKRIALIAASVSIILKELLYQITKRIGIRTNNEALIANAWHHRSDSISSIATLIGVSGAIFLADNWIILDPITAILVSVFILIIGAKMLTKSIKEMLEISVDAEKEQAIIRIINSVSGVIGCHNLRTRKIGNYFALDVHIQVNRYLNIIQAHNIATEVEKQLHQNFGEDNFISVHVEPFSSTPKI